ncbi:MAG: SpoIIE family protein phosphatase [Mogibacterium sp.]|nr:SpoIIE family protein phosphatase [Mogibacterium sp.]
MAEIETVIKMSLVTGFSVLLTYVIWKIVKDKPMTWRLRIIIGVVYGIYCVLSTHFGVDYYSMMLNVRDLGPMAAGLFFDPIAGIIAGLIGGAERYIAGTYWGIASFTSVACSISTCLAGFFAAFLKNFIFKGKKPSVAYAFFMGSVMEVFHMYVVFVTHRDDMAMALMVVKTCSIPMILFSGIGLSVTAAVLIKKSGGHLLPMQTLPKEKISVSQKFQAWLFGVTAIVLIINFWFNFSLQTNAAEQDARDEIEISETDIKETYYMLRGREGAVSKVVTHIGDNGMYVIFDKDGNPIAGMQDEFLGDLLEPALQEHKDGEYFKYDIWDESWLCRTSTFDDDARLIIMIPEGGTSGGMYMERDIQAYETFLADILIFTVIYVLISMLVQGMVVDDLIRVNESLTKITEGDLNEKVSVYNSLEFASLSNDINLTVDALKGYIEAAEKRMESELLLAHTIQDAALPKNFDFNNPAFELFAVMDPAREVGGDFYDFFFVDMDKIALVIADVAGKGIPAALFMMRSKTALRGFAETGKGLKETFEKVNEELCGGNEINMFVTVWMGILDLKTGTVRCINAGHEYPVIMHGDRGFELFKEKHSPPLGAMEGIPFQEYEMKLDPGDCLFVFTDGVPEAINTNVEQYGTERMVAALNVNRDASMQGLLSAIQSDLEDFVGTAEQFDDVTMLGIRYNGY